MTVKSCKMKKEKRKSSGTPVAAKPEKRRQTLKEQQLDQLPSWKDHGGLATAQMLDGQSLLFTGQGSIQVLTGVLDVDGFLLAPRHGHLELSSGPPGSLTIRLTARADPAQVPRMSQGVVSFSVHSPPTATDQQPATVDLSPTTSHQANGTGPQNTTPAFQLHFASNDQFTNPTQHIATSSNNATDQQQLQPSLNITQEWTDTIEAVVDASIRDRNDPQQSPVSVVTVGPKGVGKSTLTKLLISKLLNHHPVVAFMDTDCGQTEVTPSGMVSLTLLNRPLLGASCTHIQQTSFAHYIGDMSPQSDPAHYSTAIASLYQWYCSDACMAAAKQAANQHQEKPDGSSQHTQPDMCWPPLVVNTHGWVKGMGLDLLVDLINTMNPTHVIQVRSRQERKNPPMGAFWWSEDPATCPTHISYVGSAAHHKHHTTIRASGQEPLHDSQAEGDAVEDSSHVGGLSAVESRALQWHAWAKAACGHNPTWGVYDTADLYQNAVHLCTTPPFAVSLQDVEIQFMHGEPPAEHLLGSAINSVIVGLANRASTTAVEAASSSLQAGQALPVCHGLGLIRAVDMARKQLLILTNVEESLLEQVDVLLVGKGAAELPTSLLQAGAMCAVSPYLSLLGLGGTSGAALGAGTAKPRRNVGRSRLLGV